MKEQRKVTTVIVGAGNRGQNYARYSEEYPDLLQIMAVAEPRQNRRENIQKLHSLPQERCYKDWEDLVKEPKLADCAIVATQDQDHLKPSVALAKLGYHILLEKPMAVSEEDCRAIYEACQEAGVMLAVCHVLRYHPPARKLKELIDSGVIGEVVNINHTEPVGFWHFAHSFVRGNWHNSKHSTFSLLAKCCHDVDLIAYWMGNKKCVKLSSFGSLHHFRKEKKPAGGGTRCLQCPIETKCPYSAKKIYLDPAPTKPRWPMSPVCDIEDGPGGYLSNLTKAIETGPYGKCVYEVDNDVCDNQPPLLNWGHGGADFFLIKSFVQAVAGGDKDYILSGPKVSLETHLLTFAAEESRLSGTIVRPSEDPRWMVR